VLSNQARPTSEYLCSVFINCPFDEAYAPLLRAIVFTVVDCGFKPRCALETSDAGEVRIQKIYRVIEECGLGVHDLSRTQLDPGTQLPRFNMPLELGIFLGAKFLGDGEQRKKASLVFDERPNRYQMYLSDVAGQDIESHGNDPKTLLCRTRDWLASVAADPLPSGSVVWDHYETFQGELQQQCTKHKQKTGELTYNDLLRHINAFREAYVEKFEVGGRETIRNPSVHEIKRIIKSVTSSEGDSFVVFVKGASGLTYLQALMDDESSWTVEYQDGHLDRHFSASGKVNTDRVLQLFVSYASSDGSWRDSVVWDAMDL